HSTRCHRGSFLLFRNFRHECFGGEQQARDRGGVLQRAPRDLGWVDDAGLYQIDIFTLGDVVTFVAFALLNFLDNERAFRAGVVGQLPHRLFDRASHDLDADFFISVEASHSFERFLRSNKRDTATRDDAFLDCRTRRVQRVFDARLFLFHLGLGRCADVDDGHTARKFRETLLEFLAIVIAGRLFNLPTDLSDPALDVGVFARTFDDGGVFLVDGHTLGLAQVFELDVLELDPEVFADHFPTGQHRDVFQHRLATIAEARGFDRADL